MRRKKTDRKGLASLNDGCQGPPARNPIKGIGFEGGIEFAGGNQWNDFLARFLMPEQGRPDK